VGQIGLGGGATHSVGPNVTFGIGSPQETRPAFIAHTVTVAFPALRYLPVIKPIPGWLAVTVTPIVPL
jgi:hypothetical protein